MKKYAPLLITLAGILWGCLGIFVRVLNEKGLFSLDIVLLRAVVTTVCMGLFLFFFDRKYLKIRLKDFWCFLGTGICSIVFFNYCYFKAITVTSLSVAAILLYTAPAIVMILSFFLFKEAFTKKKIISLVLTFVGCVLVTGVVTNPGTVTPGGVLLGLGAGFGYAMYSIFSRFAIERGYHSMTITFYTFLLASIGTLFLASPGKVIQVASQGFSMALLCVAMGVLGTVVPYLTYTLGLKYVENSRASIIASIEPVTATLVGVFLYGEALSFSGAAGAIIVIAALAICAKD